MPNRSIHYSIQIYCGHPFGVKNINITIERSGCCWGLFFLTRPRALWAKQRERNKFRQQQQQLSSIRWISSRDASRTTTNCLPLQMNFNWGGIRISPLSSLEERSSGRGPIYNHQTKRAMCHTLICTLPFERTSSFFLFHLVFSRTMNR